MADNVVEEVQADGTVDKQYPAECGHFTSEVELALGDQRSNYLQEVPVHILCHWHLADIQDIIRDVLSKMGAKACASSTKLALETAIVQKKCKGLMLSEKSKAEERKFRSSVRTAMSSISHDSIIKNITDHRSQLFQLKRERRTPQADDAEGIQMMDEEIATMKDTITDLEKEVLDLMECSVTSDRSHAPQF